MIEFDEPSTFPDIITTKMRKQLLGSLNYV